MMGFVSNIQRFSTKDGPGLRTTVFLKGCPLRCPWCHNMETWDMRPSLLFYEKDCVSCGSCAAVCDQGAHRLCEDMHSIDRARCLRCGRCVQECPAGALELRGEKMSARQVMEIVLRDRDFYAQSGGGVTFSGGEVLMQFDFVRELAQIAAENGLHVCLDTSGWGGRAQELVNCVDLFLWDLKHTDASAHARLTGTELQPILDSLHAVDQAGGKTRIRCPIIPGINDTSAHMQAVGSIVSSLLHVEAIDLVPYHALGVTKSRALGLPVREYDKLTEEKKSALIHALRACTKIPSNWT